MYSFVQLPDYHEVIEHPMDFGTVRKNLGAGAYGSLELFEVGLSFICLLTSLNLIPSPSFGQIIESLLVLI